VRIELARSVYWRCVGQIATIERFGLPIRPHWQDDVGSDPGLGSLSVRHRAVIALTLFGGHDLQQATITLQMPTPQVVRHMREAIRYGTTASRSPAPA
jgi:hypothetical protein